MSIKQAVRADAKSPYAKYGKTPFRYSDHYYNWRDLVLKGADPEVIEDADAKHRRAFGVPARPLGT